MENVVVMENIFYQVSTITACCFDLGRVGVASTMMIVFPLLDLDESKINLKFEN
jgi:hypothetical protein